MWPVTKKRPLGIVQKKYSPRGLTFGDGAQMTPYHAKLQVAELLVCLADNPHR